RLRKRQEGEAQPEGEGRSQKQQRPRRLEGGSCGPNYTLRLGTDQDRDREDQKVEQIPAPDDLEHVEALGQELGGSVEGCEAGGGAEREQNALAPAVASAPRGGKRRHWTEPGNDE